MTIIDESLASLQAQSIDEARSLIRAMLKEPWADGNVVGAVRHDFIVELHAAYRKFKGYGWELEYCRMVGEEI